MKRMKSEDAMDGKEKERDGTDKKKTKNVAFSQYFES